MLGEISAPVLVLLGSDTKPLAATSSRHVADHVPTARMHEISGAGHAAPLTHPEALAEALTDFFTSAQQPARAAGLSRRPEPPIDVALHPVPEPVATPSTR